MLVLDDISWSDGMKRAWSRISDDERVGISVDLGEMGVCLMDKAIIEKTSIKISMNRLRLRDVFSKAKGWLYRRKLEWP